ncbi:hypothetical protein MKW98_026877 [Papaver atlanticum]|uniref:Uncharacterized protein n=1 Tax=Papaver atlanticum TaxID=357466 RepID=A0AAD4X5J4_9MAGN|nr:hypothetical protein MKW98_026877 [Papaver atlanticum]
MEKMFVRVTLGSVVGGVRLSMFTTACHGVHNLLAEKCYVHDAYNMWQLQRMRNMMFSSVLVTAVGFQLGLLSQLNPKFIHK